MAKDVLLYDFTLDEGDSYTFKQSDASFDSYVVTIERNVTIDVVAGHFEDCVRLTFDIPEAVDDEKSFTFAPGVGLVLSSFWGEGTYLYEAVVVDRVISRPTTYYPLALGNSWRYDGVEFAIDDTVSINDTLYYVVPNPWAYADTLRRSDDGNVWARSLGRDILVYDFGVADSATYQSELSTGEPGLRWTVSVFRNLTVDTPAGTFERCVLLWFDVPEAADEEHGFIFAPGIGIVRLNDVWVGNRDLVSAVVGNRIISVEDDLPTSVSTGATAYPNPFRESTTVRFPNRGATSATATVYDVLGRSVAKLATNECTFDGCIFRWDGRAGSNGLYFVVSDGDSREVVSVVLAR